MNASSDCRACTRVTGQAKLCNVPGWLAKRVLTRAITCCVVASGANVVRAGTHTGVALGPVLAMNQRLTDGTAHARVEEVCSIIGAELGCRADEAPKALTDWARTQGLPDLAAQGLNRADHSGVAEAALSASSMKGNPVLPSVADLQEVLAEA